MFWELISLEKFVGFKKVDTFQRACWELGYDELPRQQIEDIFRVIGAPGYPSLESPPGVGVESCVHVVQNNKGELFVVYSYGRQKVLQSFPSFILARKHNYLYIWPITEEQLVALRAAGYLYGRVEDIERDGGVVIEMPSFIAAAFADPPEPEGVDPTISINEAPTPVNPTIQSDPDDEIEPINTAWEFPHGN